MAAVSAAGIRSIYAMLNLPVPSDARVAEIVAKGSTAAQVRDGLIAFLVNKDPNDDLTDPTSVLIKVLDEHFAAGGIEDAAANDETEAQRLQRLAKQILSGERTLGEVTTTIRDLGTPPGKLDPDEGTTDVDPTRVGNSVIPQGGSLIRVKSPTGSDAPYMYYIVYNWRGIELAYEVGDEARFRELFVSHGNFASFTTVSQAQFTEGGYVPVGTIDQELGATESIGSRIERETELLGMEDLPDWIRNSPQALALIAQSAADEWSSGRLWKSLSETQAFKARWGGVIDQYLQDGLTIGEAVAQIADDENTLRAALRPYLPAGNNNATSVGYLHDLLKRGWTSGAVSQVLETSEALRRDPDSLALANTVLTRSGLSKLNEVQFINVLAGHGPQDTIEALNTATAGRAMQEAGIELDDEDIGILMEVVDQSDRLLTVDSWRELSQQLSLNLIRNAHELGTEKLGVVREDLIAAAFGQESPSGKSAGETLGLLARLERDRRVAAEGFEGSGSFIDDQGRLRIQGLASV